ncbi:ABC transporter permease subunit [Arthrobacter sp. 24S4-2]|uniref:ABC transporter permease subunit n=1 Tax=Arthrobacter sp. 24S4-2 TaxID=2575374 RepID=UPI0020C76190|nr:ABC transporter permease subunit [Arthrobacter sp. 24S4-2]
MKALPKELDDAAQIDGCGPFRSFLRVILPLCVPALATTAIFTFISTWNEFFGPCPTSKNQDLYTVPLALRAFMDSEGQSLWGQCSPCPCCPSGPSSASSSPARDTSATAVIVATPALTLAWPLWIQHEIWNEKKLQLPISR